MNDTIKGYKVRRMDNMDMRLFIAGTSRQYEIQKDVEIYESNKLTVSH